MDIYMIWVQEDGVTWLYEAWDEDTISENGEGWAEKVKNAHSNFSPEDVRIIKAAVDFQKVVAAFDPSTTTLELKENQ